ncbi:MAG: pantoate--beta-alanine ligase [Bacteroidia bacterium]|nr:pantoate--beta-alanine ligase [Bacteroidia bacterium]
MIICETLSSFGHAMSNLPKDCEIGFVPTMGALHNGHLSLVKKALERTKFVVASIFVNPTQFNNQSDLEHYPRTPAEDLAKLQAEGVYAVLMPTAAEIYPGGKMREPIDLAALDHHGEGPGRPGHFEGVVQVVSRLFEIVNPTFAFFGEKDFQQLAIIQHMVKILELKTEIVAVPTLREEDGLAMSSRNMLLTPAHRKAAPLIYQTLQEAADMAAQNLCTPAELCSHIVKTIDANPLLKTEYAQVLGSKTLQPANRWEDYDGARLCVAVQAGSVRLIDNIKLK